MKALWTYDPLDRLLVSTRADACIVGLFDERGHLAVSPWVLAGDLQPGELMGHSSYDVLFGGKTPGFRAMTVEERLAHSAVARGALLQRDRNGETFHAQSERRLREALKAAFDEASVDRLLCSSTGNTLLQRRAVPYSAILFIDEDLNVKNRWIDEKADVPDFRNGQLPTYLDVPLRESLREWIWSDVSRCPPVALAPVPGLIVRAFPIQNGGAANAVLILEIVQGRLSLEAAKVKYGLSTREVEVLRLLFGGLRTEETAAKLFLAEATVQDHVKRAIGKVGARNRVELAARILGWEA